MMEPQILADRYAALWNEPDARKRRCEIEALWNATGAHFVRTRAVHGYDALMERVTGSWERTVRDTGNQFRAHRNALQLHDAVMFNWDMVRENDQKVLARGLEFVVLDDAGRILADYQFNLP